jgi:DNA-directed RNA polymerase subunit M/transcription elongation factor TFIIS
MSVPNFCENCGNILEIINMYDGKLSCSSCKERFPCDGKRLVYVKHYNTGKRILSDNDVIRLIYEPTTQKIIKKCPGAKCDGNLLACIIDENCRCILGCLTCEQVFRSAK